MLEYAVYILSNIYIIHVYHNITSSFVSKSTTGNNLDSQVLRLLFRAAALLEQPTPHGRTPLFVACQRGKHGSN